jgi:hypothetical protein
VRKRGEYEKWKIIQGKCERKRKGKNNKIKKLEVKYIKRIDNKDNICVRGVHIDISWGGRV